MSFALAGTMSLRVNETVGRVSFSALLLNDKTNVMWWSGQM